MATISQPLKGATTHTLPPGSVKFDWIVLLLNTWWVGGVFVDGWAHNHGKVDQTFFTPWHAILYSGFFVTGLFFVGMVVKNHAQGYPWLRSLPLGYGTSLWGVCVFAIGGVLDLTWHLLFGIENSTAALLSPTHLTLAFGIVLAASGPFRAAWLRSAPQRQETLLGLLPTLLSLAYVYAIFTFFTQYANPVIHSQADKQAGSVELGLASILLQTAVFMGVALLAMRRWQLPPGTFAILFLLNGAGEAILGDNSSILAVAVASLLTGLLVDLLYTALKPTVERREALRFFAFLAPVTIQTVYFLGLLAIHGIAWSVHLWIGSIFMSGVIGFQLSYLLVPPPLPAEP
ncbi:MAG: hypothetical protein ABI406_05470 [Ktedonobacteraceae bacterium]